jgi:ABC-type nitrate/sulfonate/bicarbonate transport system substrate-binding protein
LIGPTLALVAILVAACGAAATPVPTQAPTAAPTTAATAAPTVKPSPAPPELKTVTVPQFAVSPLMLPTWIAIDKGLFAKQGITVEIPNVPSSQMLAGYLSGTFAFGAIGGYNPPNILAAGRKVEMYGNNYAYHLYDFFVQPETNNLKELEGKTVAITGTGGAPHAASLTLLKNNGVDTSKVTFLRTGGLNEILAALTSKQVQGGAFGPPQSVQALKAGLKRIAQMGPMRLPYPTVIIAGDPDWVNKYPNTAKAYLRGFIEGVAVLIADKTTATQVLAQRMNLNINDTELMDASYAYGADNVTRPREMNKVTDANLQSVAETYVGEGKFDINQARMTRDIIGELDKEGFFDELYAKYKIQ